MPNYGCPKYWNARYNKEGKDNPFDWLENYFSLKGLLEEFLTHKDMKILIIGCGNADFSADLYDDGYENIVNVDISDVVIKQMKEKNEEKRPHMQWIVMDITDMKPFEKDSFDLVIDKSTMDALCCADDSLLKIALMLKETIRVLRTNGHYFCISYGKPESRVHHFEQAFLSWELREFLLYDSTIESEEEKQEKSHYIYVCKVNDDANDISELYFDKCF